MNSFPAEQTVDVSAVPADKEGVRLSAVIPVLNEADNVLPLLDEVLRALESCRPFEVIFVDDGSTDDTVERLLSRLGDDSGVRLIRHARRSGQSAAVRTGVKAARGVWVVTLDGDGQNDPADIPNLLDIAWGKEGAGPALVGGLRIRRNDTLSKRLASRFANKVRQSMLQDGCVDSGCGLKLFRRDVFLELPYFGAMHRFLPALFKIRGYEVAYRPVNHRSRERGVSKYGNLRRGLIGVVDLLGVYWLKRRTPPATPASEERA
ncbi:MAG TPA: glycosyltransferase family 2 protein [Azospirillaceae bacterium]|nr:glycosyltransferase family 2 protein [Azospirillaceae bacterium]